MGLLNNSATVGRAAVSHSQYATYRVRNAYTPEGMNQSIRGLFKKLRQESGRKQDTVSLEGDAVSQGLVSRIEADPDYNPSVDVFLRALKGIGVSPAQFFNILESGEPKKLLSDKYRQDTAPGSDIRVASFTTPTHTVQLEGDAVASSLVVSAFEEPSPEALSAADQLLSTIVYAVSLARTARLTEQPEAPVHGAGRKKSGQGKSRTHHRGLGPALSRSVRKPQKRRA